LRLHGNHRTVSLDKQIVHCDLPFLPVAPCHVDRITHGAALSSGKIKMCRWRCYPPSFCFRISRAA
jgi:hypothetical protein